MINNINLLNNDLNDKVSYTDFFHALGYTDKDTIYLRTINDQDKSVPARNKQIELSYIDRIIPTLKEENSQNRGVFFVVNGGGQDDKSVKVARACFTDNDEQSLEAQLMALSSFPLEPSIIIKTRKSLHAYWLTPGGEIKYFTELQERLIQQFGSDPVIKNNSRVMRLYGFNHCKQDPVKVTLIKFDPDMIYTQRQLHEILPRLEYKPKSDPVKITAARDPIPYGQRHNYVIQRISYYMLKLADTVTDEIILETVCADFMQNCAQEPPVNMDQFRAKYLKTIQKFRATKEDLAADPGLYKKAMALWHDKNPGADFDDSRDTWDKVIQEYIEYKATQGEAPNPANTETPTIKAEAIKQLQLYYERLVKAWETEAPVFVNGDRQPFIDYITETEKLDELDAVIFKLGIDRETHDNIAHTLTEAAAAETYGTEAPAFSELFNNLIDGEHIPADPVPEDPTPADPMDSFLTAVFSERYKPIPTGIRDVDKALQGGFIRQNLIFLTAAPGMGKTTLAQQILEKMAQNGDSVLYFNLEMSREQMIARSLARIGVNGLNSLQILQAYKLNAEDQEQIRQAANIYKQRIGDKLIYNPTYRDDNKRIKETGASLNNIIRAMRQAGNKAKSEDKPAPLVCIDYLHLLTGEKNEDTTAIIKRAVEEFKQYAVDYNTIVILISASNRSANKSGRAAMDSGRDTSNIEYSGDVMLSLNYKSSDRADGESAEEIADKIKECREQGQPIPEAYSLYPLRIVKSRFTEAYTRAILRFDGEHSKFTQVEQAGYKPLSAYKAPAKTPADKITGSHEARATVKKKQTAREHKRQDYIDAYERLKATKPDGVTIRDMADELGITQASVKANIKDLLPGYFKFNDETIDAQDATIKLATDPEFLPASWLDED